MSAKGIPRAPSAFARSIGACAAGLMVALLVCAFTYMLRAVDFGPLRALVSFEDQLYGILVQPKLELKDATHPVVFLDIDDEALRKWGAPRTAVVGTPRAMIAKLTQIARAAHASVVFIDFDLRNPLPDDSVLAEELATSSSTPVLLPTFFASGILPSCPDQRDNRAPTELPIRFADAISSGSVGLVHPLVLLGSYGLIEGVCSFYRVHVGETAQIVARKAAMLRAIDLPAETGGGPVAQPNIGPGPVVIPIRWWWIRNETELLRDHITTNLAYAHIKVSLYVAKNSVDFRGVDPSGLKGAIVIIGSTHSWSDDTHATQVGELPGAIVHANVAINIQAHPIPEMPLYAQFALDSALLIAAAFVTVPVCWYPVYNLYPPGTPLPAGTRVSRLVRETGIAIVFGLGFWLLVLIIVRHGSHFLEGWRFGLLSFIVGAVVVLLIELFSMAAESAGEFGERFATSILRYFARSTTHQAADRATDEKDPQ